MIGKSPGGGKDKKTMQAKIREIASHFDVYGNYLWAETRKTGHINDTCLGVFNQAGIQVRYIFQRINHHVFKKPEELMSNVSRVIKHISGKLQGMNDASRRVMTLVPTIDGQLFHRTPDGNYWRCYLYIERARTYDVMERTEHAYQAACAFGTFQQQLSDIQGERLYDTIPDFHNTPSRLKAFDEILSKDPRNRAASVKKEIAFIEEFRSKCSIITDLLENGGVPERICHNDTKLNNVMLDDETGEAVCVIDLDTVMPGSGLYDFGDLVRSSVSPAAEDEPDLARVFCRLDIYEALTRGFLDGCNGCLTSKEIELMPFAAQLITFETGLRFLTDYIDGDHYFKIHRPEHNLDRCRTQFKLVTDLIEKEETLSQITR